MKAATILALLIGTNAIRLTDPTKKHSYPDAARILKLDPNTEFPDYPEGSIKQLDEGLCRSTDCGNKPSKKSKKELDSEKEAATKIKAPAVAEDATDGKKDKKGAVKDKAHKAEKPAEEEKKGEESKTTSAKKPAAEGSTHAPTGK